MASSRRNSRTPSGGGQTRTGGGPLSAPQTPSCPAVGSVRHRLQRTTTWALAPARPAPTDSPTVAQSATNPDTPRGIATPRPQHRRTNTPTRVNPRARASNARPLDRRRQGRTPSSTGQRVLLTSLRARLSSSRLLSATPRRTKTFHPPPSQAFLQSRPPLACAANPLAFILSRGRNVGPTVSRQSFARWVGRRATWIVNVGPDGDKSAHDLSSDLLWESLFTDLRKGSYDAVSWALLARRPRRQGTSLRARHRFGHQIFRTGFRIAALSASVRAGSLGHLFCFTVCQTPSRGVHPRRRLRHWTPDPRPGIVSIFTLPEFLALSDSEG